MPVVGRTGGDILEELTLDLEEDDLVSTYLWISRLMCVTGRDFKADDFSLMCK